MFYIREGEKNTRKSLAEAVSTAIFPRKVEILTGEIADIRGKGIMGKSNCLLVTIVTSNHSSSLIHLNV